MPEPAPPRPAASSPLLLVLAGAAAYAAFWLVGRPLLPPAVRADATAGLLPALVATAACASLLRRQPRAILWTFGAVMGLLLVFTGLMRLFH